MSTRVSSWYDFITFFLSENNSTENAAYASNLSQPWQNQVFDFVEVCNLDEPDWETMGESNTADDLITKVGKTSRLVFGAEGNNPCHAFWVDAESAYNQGDWSPMRIESLFWSPPMAFTTGDYAGPVAGPKRYPELDLCCKTYFRALPVEDDTEGENRTVIRTDILPITATPSFKLCLKGDPLNNDEIYFYMDVSAIENYDHIDTHEEILSSAQSGDLETSFDNLLPEIIKYNDGESPDGSYLDGYYKMGFVQNAQSDPHHSFTNISTGEIDMNALLAYHTSLLQILKTNIAPVATTNYGGLLPTFEAWCPEPDPDTLYTAIINWCNTNCTLTNDIITLPNILAALEGLYPGVLNNIEKIIIGLSMFGSNLSTWFGMVTTNMVAISANTTAISANTTAHSKAIGDFGPNTTPGLDTGIEDYLTTLGYSSADYDQARPSEILQGIEQTTWIIAGGDTGLGVNLWNTNERLTIMIGYLQNSKHDWQTI